MYGPTGIGVLYGKIHMLDNMEPFQTGGDMIESVNREEAVWNTTPHKFEAGTPNIAGAVGLGAAIDYLKENKKDTLRSYAIEQLNTLPFIKLYAPKEGAPILSFTIDNVHPHDASSLLSEEGICARGGHHCAMPLMESLGIPGTLRVSFAPYNTKEDVDKLIKALKKVKEVFA